MRWEIIGSVVFLSFLHGIIPSHWLPAMSLKKQYKWSDFYTIKIVSIISFAHILSTIIIGVLFSLIGKWLTHTLIHIPAELLSSIVLFLFGIIFIYRHYYHHHFHLYHEKEIMNEKQVNKQIQLLIIAMLFSPCMEITGLYFVGGVFNWQYVLWISFIYFFISFISSLLWIFLFDRISTAINFHRLEHNSGLLSGISLILSAVLIYFI
ncbi:MAG: hypothetical protein KatS3mg027_0833 [Bacteroidia bacterium]|nr:MAG: hypothetical protein KatS3mg027_0833 [Bacteroidia bacterium]